MDFLFGHGIVLADGEANFWIGSWELWIGAVHATAEGDVESSFTRYVRAEAGDLGALVPNGSEHTFNEPVLAFDEVIAKGSLTGKFADVLSDCEDLSLAYSSDYERPASLEEISGEYEPLDFSDLTLTLTIDADGQLHGSDLLGCSVQGSVSVPDASRNVYHGSADVTSCGELDGHYEGVLTLGDNGGENKQLDFALSNSTAAIFGSLLR